MNETLIGWVSGLGGGYLQHSAAGDYNIACFVFIDYFVIVSVNKVTL